jgi:hypothetical protein
MHPQNGGTVTENFHFQLSAVSSEHLKLIPGSLFSHRNFCPRRITPAFIDANPTGLLSQLRPVDGSEVENK